MTNGYNYVIVYENVIVTDVLLLKYRWILWNIRGIRGTVVARWTAHQQVERSILRQGHDS